MFSLNSYTALITGASGGIGKEIARVLAKQGANVVISGTNKDALNEVALSIKDDFDKNPIILPCNLKDKEEVKALFINAEEQAGKIDILVNNAGIIKDGLIFRSKDEDWDDVLNINLTAIFYLCRTAVKSMMQRRYGRIINMSSVVGFRGNVGQTNYCATKAGIVGFSKALALEVATRGITVNSVAPGYIESPMTTGIPEKIKEKLIDVIPQKRIGQASDVATCVAFLASKETEYITGQTLHTNGGMAMF
ncbi:MAG: 3-oxoacyl-[acyl-carrier-protein] reductase [Alphaproteobacteria bacterium]